MKLNIDKEILFQAKCSLGYRCLDGDREKLCCKAEKEDLFLYVTPQHDCHERDCRNRLELSKICYCNCPVRLEIYRSYGY